MAVPFQFSGSIEEIPLPDIVRLFQSTRKTGRLALRSGNSSGSIYVDRGEIVDCQSTNMSGLDALKLVALFNRGSFEFDDGATSASPSLNSYATAEMINILEARMQESRQLQELIPSASDMPRYLGGAIPPGLEVTAADLAVALKASAGAYSVRRLAGELNLDEVMVCYTIARYRAVGLMEIVGRDETVVDANAQLSEPPAISPSEPVAPKNDSVPGSPNSAPSAQPRYWRGRKIEG
jgi:hypothetical protein